MIKTDTCNQTIKYAHLLYIHDLCVVKIPVLLSAMQGCVLDRSSYLAPRSRYDIGGYASFAKTSINSFSAFKTTQISNLAVKILNAAHHPFMLQVYCWVTCTVNGTFPRTSSILDLVCSRATHSYHFSSCISWC